jgi:threonine/homoserine/homoserine lactone efflux protein
MPEFTPLFFAWLAGLAAGFFVSVPVGPINVTIVHEGVQRGFRWALFIGMGAVVMETIYCSLGFASFAGLFDSRTARAVMELISFVLVLYLGLKYWRTESLPATSKSADLVEQKLHPHTAFMTGFVRVLGNPAVLLFWITMSATFVSHEWVDTTLVSRTACITGVAMGATTWFVLLSFGVSRGHGRISDQTLLRMSHISGLFLLVVAAALGVRLVRLLAHHR